MGVGLSLSHIPSLSVSISSYSIIIVVCEQSLINAPGPYLFGMQLLFSWFCGMMYGGGYTLPLCKFTINLFIFDQVVPFCETIDTRVTDGG